MRTRGETTQGVKLATRARRLLWSRPLRTVLHTTILIGLGLAGGHATGSAQRSTLQGALEGGARILTPAGASGVALNDTFEAGAQGVVPATLLAPSPMDPDMIRLLLDLLGGYAGLLSVLGLARVGASRATNWVASGKSEEGSEGGLGDALSQNARELLVGFTRAILFLPADRRENLGALVREPDFQALPIPYRLALTLHVMGPDGERMASAMVDTFRELRQHASSSVPIAGVDKILACFDDERFQASSSTQQLAELLGRVAGDMGEAARVIFEKTTRVADISADYLKTRADPVWNLFQRHDFLRAPVANQVATLVATVFGPGGAKALQNVPGKGFARDLSAAARDGLLPAELQDLLAVLASDGDQNDEDFRKGILTIGGEQYLFDLEHRDPKVGSMGEGNPATCVTPGKEPKPVFVKAIKPGVNATRIEQDFGYWIRVAEMLLPPKFQTQGLAYLNRLKTSVVEESVLIGDVTNALRFNDMYREDGFGYPQPIHVSPQGNILIMEVADGVPLRDLEGEVRVEAQVAFLKAMVTQFRKGIFTTDAQARYNPETKKLTFVDAGAVATLSNAEKLQFLEELLVMITRDPKAIASHLIRSAKGLEMKAGLKEALEQDLRAGLKNGLSDAELLGTVRYIAEQHGVHESPERVLLYKALGVMAHVIDSPVVQRRLFQETVFSLARVVGEMVADEPGKAGEAALNLTGAIVRHPDQVLKVVARAAGEERLQETVKRIDGLLGKVFPAEKALSWARQFSLSKAS